MLKPLCIWIALLLGVLFCTTSQAVPTDLRVLIDISGNMYEADPKQVRQAIVTAMPALVPLDETQVGVWTFSDSVQPLIAWGPMDLIWAGSIPKALAQITDLGFGSDLAKAVAFVTQPWLQQPPDGARILLLVTDGAIDLSPNPTENQRSRSYLLQELLPQLKAKGVQIVSLALSKKADIPLLSLFAKDTQGHFSRMNDPKVAVDHLKQTLTGLIQAAQYLNKKNLFKVGATIKEMTLFVENRGEASVQLKLPNGRLINKDMSLNNVKWWSQNRKTLITIEEPMPGTWELLTPDSSYLVYQDLSLEVSSIPEKVILGETFDLSTRLLNGDRPVTDKNFLDIVHMFAEIDQSGDFGQMMMTPEDGVTPEVYKKSGSYALKIPILHQSGEAQLLVKAVAPTFLLEEKRSFTAYQTPVTIHQKLEMTEDSFVRYGVTLKPVEGLMDLGKTKLMVTLTADNGKTRTLAPELSRNQNWHFSINMESNIKFVKVEASLKGYLKDGRGFNSELTPFAIENTPKPEEPATKVKQYGLKVEQKVQKEKSSEQALLFEQEKEASETSMAWIVLLVILLIEGLSVWLGLNYWRRRCAQIRAMWDAMLARLDVGLTTVEGTAV